MSTFGVHTLCFTAMLFQWHHFSFTNKQSTSNLFVWVFSSVTPEQRETFNVYMRVMDGISQPCFCVAHHTPRAVLMLVFYLLHILAHQACLTKIVHFPLWSLESRACAFLPCSSAWLLPIFLSSLASSLSVCPKTQAVSVLVVEAEVALLLCNGKTRLMKMKNGDHDSTRREYTRKR